jgi:hypothetical protein
VVAVAIAGTVAAVIDAYSLAVAVAVAVAEDADAAVVACGRCCCCCTSVLLFPTLLLRLLSQTLIDLMGNAVS